MPDVKKLSPKNRKALLGCVKAKIEKYKKEHRGKSPNRSTQQSFFSECAKSLHLE